MLYMQKSVLVKHLKVVNHPSWVGLDTSRNDVLDMMWRNSGIGDDGGIFLMRHMDTWMGD